MMHIPTAQERFFLPECLLNAHEAQKEIAVGVREGRITRLLSFADIPAEADRVELPGQVLTPGFVNAHSHAFQRSFRGQTEYLSVGRASEDFWSWRTLMYQRALSLSPEDAYRIAHRLYLEMARAGYTTVGEFHYLHHAPDGSRYEDSTEMAQAVVRAARDAGLRISLLMVLYHSGGIQKPELPEQRRFTSRSLDEFLNMVDALQSRYQAEDCVTIGVAPHSIRAVPLPWLQELSAWNARHRLPLHMHVCEQPAEVEASKQILGAAPLEVLENVGILSPEFVGVHATHLEEADFQRLARHGAQVCACPSTEANLGDGFLPGKELLEAGVGLSIGSDSHILVSPLEELRMMENHERLRRGRRNVLAQVLDSNAADKMRQAPGLLSVGSQGGARALGLEAGCWASGAQADFVGFHLDHPSLWDCPPEWLPEALVFSAGPGAVRSVYVGGEQIV